jgi:hypothetical protein
MSKFILGAEIVCTLTVTFLFSATTPTEAKQCSTERPPGARSYWSYRLIDGRKCWYEGKPMLAKSLLHWPTYGTAQPKPRPDSDVLSANRHNLLDAHASISEDPKLKPKQHLKPEMVDASPVSPAKGPLTPNDLHAWANRMTAMSSVPIVTIFDRWPEQELPQHRTNPTPVEPSLINSRTIMMMTIVLMALLAVLTEVTYRRKRLAES